MSHYGHDNDGSIERRIQEELRARQQAGSTSNHQGTGGFARLGAHSNNSAAFMNSLMASDTNNPASPYYAQRAVAAAAQSPFGHSYASLGQPGVAQGYGQSPNDAVAAQLYAHRAAYAYGSYGIHGQHDLYAQHQMSMIDRAAAYNAQQRQSESAKASLRHSSSPLASPASAAPSPLLATPSIKKDQTTPSTDIEESPKAEDSEEGSLEPPTPKGLQSHVPEESSPATSSAVSKSKESTGTPSARKRLNQLGLRRDGPHIVSDEGHKWFPCSGIHLGLSDDKYWLSELQVFLRANFAEAFGATEEDIAAPMHGRNKPIALGQVGIRCIHCKHDDPSQRGQQATSYPSLISGIYNSVQQMLRLHMDCCQAMPQDVRTKIEGLKLSSSSRGGRKQYWVDSAKRLGMVDTSHGIHFHRDPLGPLPPLSGPSLNTKIRKKKEPAVKKEEPKPPPLEKLEAPPPKPPPPPPAAVTVAKQKQDKYTQEHQKQEDALPPSNPLGSLEDRKVVFPEDMDLISDYLYLTLQQMSPCRLMEADRVGCYKSRAVGFPGLACKHCVGQAGCGRYFPATEASLSQTTTSQTIMNHVRNCRRCPPEIRDNLELMKRSRMGPDGKKADKPKHGGRKVFFHRLWCRLQGIPMKEEKFVPRKETEKKRKKSSPKKASKRKRSSDHDDSNIDDDAVGPRLSDQSDEVTESEGSDSEAEEALGEKKKLTKKKAKRQRPVTWHEGCVRLTKSDDPNWLSEMQCFSRSDLVEVFSWKESDGLEGHTGRKEPLTGQVAIRCVFCKTIEPSERPSGCLIFPEKLSAIHTKVMDMLRLHFHSCPGMPDETKETFKTLRGFGAKVTDDSHQYWVDSARDIGLSNTPPSDAMNAWGITFRRDPLQPSPCDELDREVENGTSPVLSPLYLIKAEDRGSCTDQYLLMMRQIKVCTFESKDRRGGPGARGRDRVTGFPGLCCKFCSSKNNSGRYFPVSAKNLSDNTANSLQTHLASCNRCPESIKGSIAYLSHRSILQKGELNGSWKKSFFKTIWDRLHVERAWAPAMAEAEAAENASHSSDEEVEDDGTGESDGDDDEINGEELLGDNMTALIKAAAIWLTEQEKGSDAPTRTKTSRGRTLPNKRTALETDEESPKAKSRSGGSSLTSGKRRRVHF